jgi:hypothetical protein
MRWTPSHWMNSLIKSGSSPKGKTLAEIRQALLDAMGEQAAHAYPVVQLRVTYAEDIQDLWYLRGDVLTAIASTQGEAKARSQLSKVSEMFRGSLPSGLTARPSRLGR